jgi:hypothetical protein
MNRSFQDQLLTISEKIVEYLPSFFAGILLVFLGWFLGWFAKRVVIQLALIIRLERYITRFRWGKDFSKGDVRYGFYNFIGNIIYFIVFLIFLDNALRAWHLEFLSSLLEKGILLFPRIIIALLIFGIGILLTNWASRSIQRSLRREHIPRATLVARFARATLILMFSAMALIELNVARQVIIIGFATIIITLGVLSVAITIIGGKDLIKSIQDTLDEE